MTDRPPADEWRELLARRPTFREALAPYGAILDAWAAWRPGGVAPLHADAETCGARWRRGLPLLAEAPPPVEPEAAEALVGPVLETLAAVGVDAAALERFVRAWDSGALGPPDLFPGQGRLGSAAALAATGLSQEALGFVAYAGLRPILEAYFAGCRAATPEGAWDLGLCPFCGAPPGFAEFGEDGKRRLACHLCGGSWVFSRLRCPYCGGRTPTDLVRLQAEAQEEGYAIDACRACRGYLKTLDRRVRWDTGSALIEDWGSPHFDVAAQRDEYWRAVPTLVDIATRRDV